MRLEAVQQEPVEPKPIPQMLTKKKNLLLAGQIINIGAESLRKSLNVSKIFSRYVYRLIWRVQLNRSVWVSTVY